MNWKKILTNLLGTFLTGFAAGYPFGGWKNGIGMGISAMLGNQVGLHQKQP